MNTLKPIETRYMGYRFRSRLEARWAIWLDHIGWLWEYEPEGFDLGDGDLYLPDFRLRANTCSEHQAGSDLCWLEVKPTAPSEEEKRKAYKLAMQSGHPVLFGVGLPDAASISYGLDGFDREEASADLRENLCALDSYCFRKWGRPGWLLYNQPEPLDRLACNAARSARFEFGESGAS